MIYASDEFLAGKTPINMVSVWAGNARRAHVVCNSCSPEDAKLIVHAVNCHNEWREILESVKADLEAYQHDDENHLTVELVADYIGRIEAALAKAKGHP